MTGKDRSAEDVVAMLAETPSRLEALTGGLSSGPLSASPGSNDWSANDILAHLRACADVWGQCIARILAEERPAWRAVNPRTWLAETDYRDLEFHASLRSFVQQRSELTALLASLPPEGWRRLATVSGEGQVHQRDVYFYARRMALHETSHVKQIADLVDRLPSE